MNKKYKRYLLLSFLLIVLILSYPFSAIAAEMDSDVGFVYTDYLEKPPTTPNTGGGGGGGNYTNQRLPQTGETTKLLETLAYGGLLLAVIGMLVIWRNNHVRSEMKMKWLVKTASALLLVVCLIHTGEIVKADVQKSTETDVTTGFSENPDTTPPVSPGDHTELIVPPRPPTQGPLSLNFTSDFIFGPQPMTDEDSEYFAQLTDTERIEDGLIETNPNFIQLTDNRGSLSGWKLYVRQNAPLTNKSGFQLVGTQIVFKNITAVSLDEEETRRPTGLPRDDVKLDGDTQLDRLIAEAHQGTGYGSWMIQFGDTPDTGRTSVSLRIPGDTPKQKGIYSTTLTWSLVDGI